MISVRLEHPADIFDRALEWELVVFSADGFDRALLTAAREREDVELVDLVRIYTGE